MEKLLLKEKISKKMKDWKDDVFQMKEQLENSLENVADSFEKQKDNLLNWTKKMEKELHQFEGLNEEKLNHFKGKLQNLRVQLALGKAETEVILKEQQKKINQAIRELKQSITGISKNPEGQGNFWDKAIQRLENFQMRFDLFKLQLNLGEKEGRQQWMEKKKEINNKLQEIEIKLEKGKEVTQERLDHFSKEVSVFWKNLRKTIMS
jgi:hypothetical protein